MFDKRVVRGSNYNQLNHTVRYFHVLYILVDLLQNCIDSNVTHRAALHVEINFLNSSKYSNGNFPKNTVLLCFIFLTSHTDYN